MSLHNASSFYKQIDGRLSYWDLATAEYTELPSKTENIQLRLLEEKRLYLKTLKLIYMTLGMGFYVWSSGASTMLLEREF